MKDANAVSSTDLLAIAIPPKDLIDMLKDSVWYSGGRDFGGKSGYSLEVDESTCYRDVLYDNVALHETPEDAIYEYWKAHYS